jgi:uncharacterized protein YwgA
LILQLVLNELGVKFRIDSVDDRITVQKAVYLAQLAGVDLGYRFSWYRFGPYCSDLADAYYALDRSVRRGESTNNALADAAKGRLAKVKALTSSKPPGNLKQKDWLELLASVHYLWAVSKFDDQRALSVMQRQKSNLVAYIEAAKAALQGSGLVSFA